MITNIIKELFQEFNDKIEYRFNSIHLSNKLLCSFEIDDPRYSDDFIYQSVLQYFKEKLIPHKTEVFKSGLELSRMEWFERLNIDIDEFIYNLYIHDLSKFSVIEAIPYALHDFGSPNFSDEMKYAWCHHKAINKHHPEHWLNPMRNGELKPLPMDNIFIVEMIADWIGAGKCYGDPFEVWVPKNIDTFKFHPETEQKVRTILKEMNIL